jgi:hypothetical protein
LAPVELVEALEREQAIVEVLAAAELLDRTPRPSWATPSTSALH